MKNSAVTLSLLLSCVSLSPSLFANSDDTSSGEPKVEEMMVIGSKRQGDYTIITQNTEKLVETAGAMGDPLAAVFALPGVVYADGQEPAVRGSSPNDNQFVVDFMPASYIFHAFGVSIFSEFILHDFQMYSAGFGPEYSNATGAVFDVRLRQPKNEPLSAVVDFSMLRSGVFLEGGVTDSSSFYLSYRQSLIDLFVDADALSDEDEGIKFTKVPSDNDYQFKYSWDVNEYHRLSLSANGASDNAEAELNENIDFVASNPDFAGDAKIEEKYTGQNIVWEYTNGAGTEFTLGYGLLNDNSLAYWGDSYAEEVNTKQSTIKSRFSLPAGKTLSFDIGSQLADINLDYLLDSVLFVCTEFDPACDDKRTEERLLVRSNNKRQEISHYINTIWTPSNDWRFDFGVQYQANDYTDETFYLPRLAAAWQVAPQTTLTAKAGQYNRFPDLGTVMPETGNPDIASPTANHFTLGVAQAIENGWSVSLEGYYKTLDKLPKAIAANEPNSALHYVNGIEGKARGIDLMINKNRTDQWWGWFALSYGNSERTDISTGETREYYLDTPFIANWVMNYQFRPNMNIGWRWSIRSGQTYTPIDGIQQNPWFEDSVLPVYGEAFSERLPYYNRLDIRFSWETTTFGKDSELIIDIINALNHKNISDRSLDYQKVNSIEDEVITVDEASIGLQPAITFRMSF